jgi:hypothetical protein
VLDAPADAGPAPEAPAVSESAPPPPFAPPVAEPAVGWVSQSHDQAAPPIAIDDLDPSALKDFPEEPAGVELEPSSGMFDEPARPADSVEPIDGLVGREVDVVEEADEFRVETSEDIVLRSSGGNEFQVPDASQELFAGSSMGERTPFEENAPLPPPVAHDDRDEDGDGDDVEERVGDRPGQGRASPAAGPRHRAPIAVAPVMSRRSAQRWYASARTNDNPKTMTETALA